MHNAACGFKGNELEVRKEIIVITFVFWSRIEHTLKNLVKLSNITQRHKIYLLQFILCFHFEYFIIMNIYDS